MKLFKNKFFIVCLSVAAAIAVLMSVFSLMGYRALVRNVVGTVATPFRLVGNLFCGAVEGFGKQFRSVKELEKQNSELEEENRALREQIERAERLEAENERLREFLGMKSEYPTFTMEEGTVIGREGENHLTLLTLNRGSVHGIRVNMAVITKDGIVGCVREVGRILSAHFGRSFVSHGFRGRRCLCGGRVIRNGRSKRSCGRHGNDYFAGGEQTRKGQKTEQQRQDAEKVVCAFHSDASPDTVTLILMSTVRSACFCFSSLCKTTNATVKCVAAVSTHDSG